MRSEVKTTKTKMNVRLSTRQCLVRLRNVPVHVEVASGLWQGHLSPRKRGKQRLECTASTTSTQSSTRNTYGHPIQLLGEFDLATQT